MKKVFFVLDDDLNLCLKSQTLKDFVKCYNYEKKTLYFSKKKKQKTL